MFKAGLVYFTLSVSPTSLMIETYLLSLPPHLIHFRRNNDKLRHELHLDSNEYSNVDPAVLDQFDTLLRTYPHAFLLPGAPLRRIHGTEHHISTGNAPPCYKPLFRKSPPELQTVRHQINDMLRQYIIRPSKSPWGAPAILVGLKDLHGKPQPPRFVVDYRALNSVTKRDGFPQVIDILDWLGGGKALAKLDLANGYWQVPVREADREKTAVVTHCGLFEFISIPFGLKTAGATFQRLMQASFSDFLMGNVTGSSDNQHGFCMPHIDDLITRSMSHVDALEHYRRIFERATQVGMQFKPSKCTFFSTHLELKYLVMLSSLTVVFQTPKIQAITSFPMVNSQSAVQKFLGMVGFYKHHISRFAQWTYHLRQLLQKNKKFHLTAQVEAKFKDLIAALIGPDVLLHYPDCHSTYTPMQAN